jgi:hypothetical protein
VLALPVIRHVLGIARNALRHTLDYVVVHGIVECLQASDPVCVGYRLLEFIRDLIGNARRRCELDDHRHGRELAVCRNDVEASHPRSIDGSADAVPVERFKREVLDLWCFEVSRIAGGNEFGGFYLDSHAGACPRQVWEVWEMLEPVAAEAPNLRASRSMPLLFSLLARRSRLSFVGAATQTQPRALRTMAYRSSVAPLTSSRLR